MIFESQRPRFQQHLLSKHDNVENVLRVAQRVFLKAQFLIFLLRTKTKSNIEALNSLIVNKQLSLCLSHTNLPPIWIQRTLLVWGYQTRNFLEEIWVSQLSLTTFTVPYCTPTDNALSLLSLLWTFVSIPSHYDYCLFLKQMRYFARKLLPANRSFLHFRPPRSQRWTLNASISPHIQRLTNRLIQRTVGLLPRSHQCCFPNNLSAPASPTIKNVGAQGSLITTADNGVAGRLSPQYLTMKKHLTPDPIFIASSIVNLPFTQHTVLRSLRLLKRRKFSSRIEFISLFPSPSQSMRRFQFFPKLAEALYLATLPKRHPRHLVTNSFRSDHLHWPP